MSDNRRNYAAEDNSIGTSLRAVFLVSSTAQLNRVQQIVCQQLSQPPSLHYSGVT
jgi:hypothetical protein